ncbi:hypothetical protein [Ferrovibrio sp.]|nr:hypothetical protein [Ferrovibrio sp.]
MTTVDRHSLSPLHPSEVALPKPCGSCAIGALYICDSLSPAEQSSLRGG